MNTAKTLNHSETIQRDRLKTVKNKRNVNFVEHVIF